MEVWVGGSYLSTPVGRKTAIYSDPIPASILSARDRKHRGFLLSREMRDTKGLPSGDGRYRRAGVV